MKKLRFCNDRTTKGEKIKVGFVHPILRLRLIHHQSKPSNLAIHVNSHYLLLTIIHHWNECEKKKKKKKKVGFVQASPFILEAYNLSLDPTMGQKVRAKSNPFAKYTSPFVPDVVSEDEPRSSLRLKCPQWIRLNSTCFLLYVSLPN